MAKMYQKEGKRMSKNLVLAMAHQLERQLFKDTYIIRRRVHRNAVVGCVCVKLGACTLTDNGRHKRTLKRRFENHCKLNVARRARLNDIHYNQYHEKSAD